jgi:putative ABC transport system substrate-binding protein
VPSVPSRKLLSYRIFTVALPALPTLQAEMGASNKGDFPYPENARTSFRRAASYVACILRGAKPSELPVQLPTKFEMVLNLKTAKALGLAVPPSILPRADEIIE